MEDLSQERWEIKKHGMKGEKGELRDNTVPIGFLVKA